MKVDKAFVESIERDEVLPHFFPGIVPSLVVSAKVVGGGATKSRFLASSN